MLALQRINIILVIIELKIFVIIQTKQQKKNIIIKKLIKLS